MLSLFSLFFQEKHERISRENWSRNSITEAAREAKNKLRIAECRNKCGKWRWGRGFRIKLRTFPPFFASSDTHLTFPCNATKKCFFFRSFSSVRFAHCPQPGFQNEEKSSVSEKIHTRKRKKNIMRLLRIRGNSSAAAAPNYKGPLWRIQRSYKRHVVIGGTLVLEFCRISRLCWISDRRRRKREKNTGKRLFLLLDFFFPLCARSQKRKEQ